MRRRRLQILPYPILLLPVSCGNDVSNVAISADASLTTITIQGMWSDAWPRLAVAMDTLLPPESPDVELAHVGEVAASADGRVAVFDPVLRRVWASGADGRDWRLAAQEADGPEGPRRVGVMWWMADTLMVLDPLAGQVLAVHEDAGLRQVHRLEQTWPTALRGGRGSGERVVLAIMENAAAAGPRQEVYRPRQVLLAYDLAAQAAEPDTVHASPGRAMFQSDEGGMGVQPLGPDGLYSVRGRRTAVADGARPEVTVLEDDVARVRITWTAPAQPARSAVQEYRGTWAS